MCLTPLRHLTLKLVDFKVVSFYLKPPIETNPNLYFKILKNKIEPLENNSSRITQF